jgi:N-methylhydantoinase A
LCRFRDIEERRGKWVLQRDSSAHLLASSVKAKVSVALPMCAKAGDLPRIGAEFERTYESLYGRKGPDVPLEVINWRVVASGPRPDMIELPRFRWGGDARVVRGWRSFLRPTVMSRSGFMIATLLSRVCGSGPAIVEERESTLIIGAKGCARVDERLNVVVELGDGK